MLAPILLLHSDVIIHWNTYDLHCSYPAEYDPYDRPEGKVGFIMDQSPAADNMNYGNQMDMYGRPDMEQYANGSANHRYGPR